MEKVEWGMQKVSYEVMHLVLFSCFDSFSFHVQLSLLYVFLLNLRLCLNFACISGFGFSAFIIHGCTVIYLFNTSSNLRENRCVNH